MPGTMIRNSGPKTLRRVKEVLSLRTHRGGKRRGSASIIWQRPNHVSCTVDARSLRTLAGHSEKLRHKTSQFWHGACMVVGAQRMLQSFLHRFRKKILGSMTFPQHVQDLLHYAHCPRSFRSFFRGRHSLALFHHRIRSSSRGRLAPR